MISFIVPAHNEQACLPRTLRAIHESAATQGRPYEIIVVDDASTDATPEIARQQNARVVSVQHRQIAATRNAGGRAATGEHLFFVDADTTIHPRAVASALLAMEKGAVGGGGPTLFEGAVPLYGRLISYLGIVGAKAVGFTGGAFMFCTRAAFQATGGFDERLFWAEEGTFALALKREGRFAVLWRPVRTSARRFRTLSGRHFLTFLARTILAPHKVFTHRSSVEKIWYDSNRAQDEQPHQALAAQIVNAIILLVVLVLVTGPVWNFIPRSLTPPESAWGQFRLVCRFIIAHVGLVLWPFALILFRSLWQRLHWIEWMKLAAVFAFCLWQAWSCTRAVVTLWTSFYHGLTG
jgi:glycosyltransferase involved in cell wall biosynthesis